MQQRKIASFCLLALLLSACVQSGKRDDFLIGGSFSALPNIGASIRAGQVFHETPGSRWWLELEGTYQFLDDEDIADDGFPKAGDFTQIALGVVESREHQESRRLTVNGGLVWFRALGQPNIVQEPGDYVGVYYGVGFETRVSAHVTTGPELTVIAAYGESSDELVFVPQLNWHLSFGF